MLAARGSAVPRVERRDIMRRLKEATSRRRRPRRRSGLVVGQRGKIPAEGASREIAKKKTATGLVLRELFSRGG